MRRAEWGEGAKETPAIGTIGPGSPPNTKR